MRVWIVSAIALSGTRATIKIRSSSPAQRSRRRSIQVEYDGIEYRGLPVSWVASGLAAFSSNLGAPRDMPVVVGSGRHPSRRVRHRDRSASSTAGSLSGKISSVIARCRMRSR